MKEQCTPVRLLKAAARVIEGQNPIEDDVPFFVQSVKQGKSVFAAAIALTWFNMQLGYRGAMAINSGDSNGWQDVHTVMYHRAFALYCGARVVDDPHAIKPGGGFHPWAMITTGRVAYLLAYAMAIGWTSVADFVGERLLQLFINAPQNSNGFAWESNDGFEAFALYLYCHQRSLPQATQCRLALQDYPDILQDRADPVAYTNKVVRLCRLHCRLATKDAGPFDAMPEAVIPAEIIAADRLREASGEDPIAHNHPLLTGPLASMPHTPPSVAGELLTPVIERCQQIDKSFSIPSWVET